MDINAIKDPSFLKQMNIKELEDLAYDIRAFMIANISQTGGHLSSNLGVVELTMALHYVFDSPRDKIFFDVGHQCYTHKILTGRANDFSTLRKYNGLSGFQKRCESIHDVWEAGHSSTALSAAVGMALSRDLSNEKFDVIPVIGDASIVGGMSLEALNHLGSTNSKVIIILNDNQMSISQNVGGINDFLSKLRTSMTYNKAKQEYKEQIERTAFGRRVYRTTKRMKDFIKSHVIQDSIFTEFGVDYIGPIDGHDFKDLIRALTKAKNSEKSIVVHILTKKGKGYVYSENDIDGSWHGPAPFDIQTGRPLQTISDGMISWSKLMSNSVEQLMDDDKDIVVVTPAMVNGSKLESIFSNYPERAFDVGIAEQHAATFAAGLSISGKKPYLTIYSSFIQRAYDQINHDIARMNLPMLISIDRAGLVGDDGETHHGVFDLGIFLPIPNLNIFSPLNAIEAQNYVYTAFKNNDGPYIIRFPRGNVKQEKIANFERLEIGSWSWLHKHQNNICTLISYGPELNDIVAAIDSSNLRVNIINARFIKPMDYNALLEIASFNHPVIIYETSQKIGGLGSQIIEYYNSIKVDVNITSFGLEDKYIPQGKVNELLHQEKLDIDSLILFLQQQHD